MLTATPVRPRWVTYAAIGGGSVVGAIAFAVAFATVSSAFRPATPPAAEPATAQQTDPEPPAAIAGEPKQSPGPTPAPQPSGSLDQHREAVDAVVRAYNAIADGYARVRDVNSLSDGNGSVARAVNELRSAARRGRSLPALSPDDRAAVIDHGGPALLAAIDRVLGELRRLKETPGLRSDFDRLIDAYSRASQEVRREIDRR